MIMMETRYYKVGGHVFGVTADERYIRRMGNYEPFECGGENTLFALTVGGWTDTVFTEDMRQEEEGKVIISGTTTDGSPMISFSFNGQATGLLVCNHDYTAARLSLSGHNCMLAINDSLMILYALATAHHDTALFHAAVVSKGGKAYMFLGKSGTGKSTHARLWLNHVEGTELVNDDNPVARVADGAVTVYGSPWSGKTPCYRNVSYPLGGIVRLSQAPYNKIRRLTGVEAYAAIVPSISGKRWDPAVADGLHATENALASIVPIWHLECLPDETAALTCVNAVTK